MMLARSSGQILRLCSRRSLLAQGFQAGSLSTDARYQATGEVPGSVMENMHSEEVFSPGFSIKGEARDGRPAYLDFQATTPQDPRVLDAMLPYMIGKYGNPHSKTHTYGWETESAVEDARAEGPHN